MSTSASLFIDDLPDVGAGVKRYLVDCKWSTTRLFWCPAGPVELTEAMLIAIVLQRHEDGCGRCNTARLWRRADPRLKAAVEELERRLATMAVAERRN